MEVIFRLAVFLIVVIKVFSVFIKVADHFFYLRIWFIYKEN